MKNTLLFATAIACSLLVISCDKETNDNDQPANANVAYQLTTSDRLASMGRFATTEPGSTERVTAGSLLWTGGTATVSEIKFKAKGDDDALEYKSKSTKTINLFDPLSPLGTISVPAGTYEKIDFKIKFEPMSGSSLRLTGNYTNSAGVVTPVVFIINEPFEIKFQKKTPTTIDAATVNTVLSTLSLSTLVDGVSETMMNNAVRDGSGVIVISSTSNTNIYNLMWAGLENVMKVKIK